jgi:ornithine cyclodeaminase/alanine dehydrogenase-like protein (mu-crystallin family)
MLIISHSEVRELLPMRDCMEVVAEALSDLARGAGLQPLRAGILLPHRQGVLAWMPGALASGKHFGVKILSVFENAAEMGFGSHQGGVLIFDPENGRPLAMAEAGAITAVRTAAVTALATDHLARRNAVVLAILGSGTQARSHVEAMLEVRPIAQVRIWSRTRASAELLADEESGRCGVPIDAVSDVAAAVEGADIICTTTSAREPILPGALLTDGMHVNAVGASVPSWRELDTEVVRRSRLFTDRRESLTNEAGEYRLALREGVIDDDHLQAELGEVLIGMHPGRASDNEITLFRSLGLAVEDLAATRLVYERAVERGIGTEVDLTA